MKKELYFPYDKFVKISKLLVNLFMAKMRLGHDAHPPNNLTVGFDK